MEGLVDVSDVDESEESDDEDSDDSSSTTSGNEPPIPLFRMDEGMVHGILSDEEDEEDAQDNDWHPFEPFGLNLEQAGELNNVIDVFRRIAYGLNSTRTSIQFDTLPPPRPLDPQKIDLYRGNLPPVGSIPMHRNFLIPPFTNAIVSLLRHLKYVQKLPHSTLDQCNCKSTETFEICTETSSFHPSPMQL